MFNIPIKPLSQNLAWTGKKYRTQAYRDYKMALKTYFLTLPLPTLKANDPIYLIMEFGTTRSQDCSNNIKLFEDCLCEHLGINDRQVMSLFARKVYTSRKNSFIKFNIFNNEYDFLKSIIDNG